MKSLENQHYKIKNAGDKDVYTYVGSLLLSFVLLKKTPQNTVLAKAVSIILFFSKVKTKCLDF